MALIESVPNFSEGRDPVVLDAIVAAMIEVPGAYLLAREMDPDHHRSVVTLAGEAEAVAEAVVRGAGAAAERIDLRQHRGVHPRVGATDVVPFVPLDGATLEECVYWATWAGAEIWRRYQIPVYLYEAAARRAERRQLEVVRRGQFEGLREEVRTDPERQPDFGPPFESAGLHPTAGATIVGARKFLIAFNINLDTANVEVARSIARAVRASSGGLPAVKAMGVRLTHPPRAQVSMNLTDFETTSVSTVWRTVEEEAAKRGARAVESELIGLLPRAALESAGAELLHLTAFDANRVIENRLAQVQGSARHGFAARFGPWLQALAGQRLTDEPHQTLPGAGSAAAVAGAMAAALGQRAARAAAARRLAAPEPDLWSRVEAELNATRLKLAWAADDDREACRALAAARRLPQFSPAEANARASALDQASVHAVEVPMAIAVQCLQIQDRLRELQTATPPALAGEVLTASQLAQAAYASAEACVSMNLAALPAPPAEQQRLRGQLEKLRHAAAVHPR